MSKKKSIPADPYASREAEKYANPVPSREFILETLTRADRPLLHAEVCELLNVHDEEQVEAVRRRLIAMARDGQLISNRRDAFMPIDKVDLIRGRVQGHRDGYGFVIRGDGGGDIYLHNRQMRKVFDGDEVLVRLSGESYRGKDEGTIVEVLAHNTSQLAGRFYNEENVPFVRPENAKVTQDVMVSYGDTLGAKPGQIVVVEITRQPDKSRPPMGRVIQVLGDHMAPGMEIELAIQSHGIPRDWPTEVVDEAAAIPAEVQAKDKKHRIDVRNLPFVTIDGEDARDFDDAVLCERRRGGWRLMVAIADVSHYVAINSALDKEAKLRGNSVYFPDYVVPMLPEALSNGLCSLNPHVDRLCMVCEMTISDAGRITGYQFYEAIMSSHARLTYTQVAALLDGEAEQATTEAFIHVLPQLQLLHRLYQCLRIARDERGAIDFETVETRIVFNEDRKIERIIPVRRNDAHKLIEECMLCANVCAARFLEKHGLTSLYRVHEGPTEQKLTNLREFLGELGLGLSGGATPDSGDYQRLMQDIQGRADANMIQTVMLRSLRQAVYQVENHGHFGLGYDAYTHFTSPIRRYPDLLVHRAIRSVIASGQASAHVRRLEGAKVIPAVKTYPYGIADVLALGEQCSLTERRADEATRDVVSWLKCEYLRDQVGSVFEGVVSAVTGFGLFVELKDLYVDGLVHISSLPHDYYRFEAAQHRLVGERTRKVYGLGDELVVRVVRVDLDNRKIDFDLESVVGGRRKAQTLPVKKSKGASGAKSEDRTARKIALKQLAQAQIKPKKSKSGATGLAKVAEPDNRGIAKPKGTKKSTVKNAPKKIASKVSGADVSTPSSTQAAAKKVSSKKVVAVKAATKKVKAEKVTVAQGEKLATKPKSAAVKKVKANTRKVVETELAVKASRKIVKGEDHEQNAAKVQRPKAAKIQPNESGAPAARKPRGAPSVKAVKKTLDKPEKKK